MTDSTKQPNTFEKTAFLMIRSCFRAAGLVSNKNARRIAGILGDLVYRLDAKHRNIALNNLALAFGNVKSQGQIEAIARQVFSNLFLIIFEIGWMMHWKPIQIQRKVQFSGWDNYRRTLRKGRGALMLLAHTGNWELLPVVVPNVGVPVNVLYRPLDFKPLDRFFRDIRSRLGARMISTRRSARKVLRALEHNEVVAVLMDQNVDWYEGVFVDFFGRRAATNKGFAMLALKTGVPVLPMFIIREKDRFRVEVWPEIPLIRTGDRTKDIEQNTQQYNDVIEQFVRKYPDQWFWVHQRWKTRPYLSWPKNFQERR